MDNEAARLRTCLDDLVSLIALPALSPAGELGRIVDALLDALLGKLEVSFLFARLHHPEGGAPIETLRLSGSSRDSAETSKALRSFVDGSFPNFPPRTPLWIDGEQVWVASALLGLQGELGLLIAGANRVSFPEQTERIVLQVASNQVAIVLLQARLRAEQSVEGQHVETALHDPEREALARWHVLLTGAADQKRAEELLHESEREARLVVDTIPGLVVILDESGAVTFENRRTREYLGPELSDTGRWASNGIVHPEDIPRVFPLFASGVASGEPFDYEVRLRHRSGVPRWFHLRAHPLRDSSDRVSRWYVLLTDIDDRRRMEEELRRNEVFLTEGQRISLTGTFAWQVDTDELTFSDELRRIFQFERDLAITFERISERVYPSDLPLLANRMADVRAGRDNPEYEIRLQMRDRTIRYVRVFGRVIKHQGGRLECVGAVQDITRRRLAEDARDAARSELAHVTKAMTLSALTASIAHEVNQPLSGIMTNASTCARMLAAEPPDVIGARETVKRTIRDINRASDVVTRLRALFANRQFALELFDLNEATREVLELSQGDLKRSHVIVRTELAEDLPTVKGDRIQLQQVILNLIRNAADAMASVQDRGRHLFVRTQREGAQGVCLMVRDEGEGFDPQNVDKLFDPFYTTKSGGMGIGLSVSRSIVERHHGRLWAEPNADSGATFSFFVPLTPPPDADALPATVPS